MIVISDTSPVNNLAAIGQLSLLQQLYETLIIPEAVYEELIGPPPEAGAEEARNSNWIQVQSATDRAIVKALMSKRLHIGESEAIALALEIGADQVLVDDKSARNAAEDAGLRVTGIVGILIEAKSQGLISEIRPLLDLLRSPVNFWISESLYRLALRTAKEI
ncbi:MAG: DUF3368 domain-containing protein [Phormidesmis sp.]